MKKINFPFAQKQKGAVTVLVALTLPVLVGAAALAVQGAFGMQTAASGVCIQHVNSARAQAQKPRQSLRDLVRQRFGRVVMPNGVMNQGQTLVTPGPLFVVRLGFLEVSHHRGQVTTLLSQAGIDPGDTDLLFVMPSEPVA